jgi:putative FmdB family regulatory protein
MPLYEYNCKQCNRVFERVRGIDSDDNQVECPKCKKKNPKRVYSLFSSPNSYNCIPRFSSG